jgi:hypothetical protein
MSNITENHPHLRLVAQFARNNPRAKIDCMICSLAGDRIPPPGFPPILTQASWFMTTGIWLTRLVRLIDLRGIMPAGTLPLSVHYMYFYHADRLDGRFEWLNVPNLKFFFPGEKVLQENFERDLILDWATAEVAKVCVEYAKSWIKNGI